MIIVAKNSSLVWSAIISFNNSFLNFILILPVISFSLYARQKMRFKYIQIVQNNIWKRDAVHWLFIQFLLKSIAWFLLQVSDLLFVFPTNWKCILQDSSLKIVHIQKSLKNGVKKALCMIIFCHLTLNLWTPAIQILKSCRWCHNNFLLIKLLKLRITIWLEY